MKQRRKHNSLISSEFLVEKTMKEKRIEVEKYLLKYKKNKIQLKCYDSLLMLNQKKKIEKEEIESYILFVDTILKSLSEESNEYFQMEYFTENYDLSWWENKYSKNVFFKIRNRAYSEFLMYAI